MERFGEWLWGRWRAHYRLSVFVGVSALTFPFLTLCGAWGATRVYGAESSMIAEVVAVVLPIEAVGLAVAFWSNRRDWDAIHRWGAGDRISPQHVIDACLPLPRRLMVSTLVVALLLVNPAITGWWSWRIRLTESEALAFYGVLAVASYMLAVMVRSVTDLLLGPVNVEASAAIRGGARLAPRHVPASVTLRVEQLALAAVVGAVALGAAVVAPHEPGAELVRLMLLAIVGFGTLLFVVLRPVLFWSAWRPLRDLVMAIGRMEEGDFSQPVALTSDDELGNLVSAFNGMQQGLAERERLQAAFGSYVDPALAARLVEQGHELFDGERVEVTVLFADVRDFTPYAESHGAEETVGRLNELFSIIVPVINAHGGHTNKYLGDGAMAVFGVPEPVADHADRAVAAAIEMQRQVAERFGDGLRIGVGINTGTVIAGTIGGGGKLEFTLIGDAVNVAARVEQLTKETADRILLTDQTRQALEQVPAGLVERGAHELKGKTEPVTIHALDLPTLVH